jgi:dUTP pyrophosphatase
MIKVLFTVIDQSAILPTQAHPGEDAGWDLHALEDTHCPAGKLTWIRTGVAIAVPEGFYGRVVGRSSAASKGFHVVEGVIDSGYRGELLTRVCPLWLPQDLSRKGWHHVKRGDSLAQLIVSPFAVAEMVEVEGLPESRRGVNGFGSSGR